MFPKHVLKRSHQKEKKIAKNKLLTHHSAFIVVCYKQLKTPNPQTQVCTTWYACHEEFHLEGHRQNNSGLSGSAVETSGGQGRDGSRLSYWRLGARYSPFLSAQLPQPQSCSVSSCQLPTTALVLRK